MIRVFSTDPIAAVERRGAWARATRAAFGSLEVLDVQGPLQACLEVSPLATARIVAVSSTAQRVRRIPRPDALAETINVLVQTRGACGVEHRGRSLRLAPGELVLVDGRLGFELVHEGPFEQLLFQLPRALVQARL